MTLALDAALTPSLLSPRSREQVVILIDALRATSTLATLFHLGAARVDLPQTLREARRLAAAGFPVAAEMVRGGQARGCTIPVSPSLLTTAPVHGRTLALCTTNGTRATRLVARRARYVLFGSLLNVSATAARAVRLAGPNGTIVAVCAGREWNRIPCLDDTYTAGVLLDRLRRQAEQQGLAVRLTDAATIAQAVAASFPDARTAFERSATAAVLRRAGSEGDVAFCARLDVAKAVPELAHPSAALPRYPVYLLEPRTFKEHAA